jgi:hypothetical protein
MGQGFIASARSKAVLTPSALAFSRIFRVAGSTLFVTSDIEITLLKISCQRSAISYQLKSNQKYFC